MRSEDYGEPIKIWPESPPLGIESGLLEALALAGRELATAAELERAGVHSTRIDAAMATVVRLCKWAAQCPRRREMN